MRLTGGQPFNILYRMVFYFLNYFDSSIGFQLSFINRAANRENAYEHICIPQQGDEFDEIRAEYTDMLRNQLSKGDNDQNLIIEGYQLLDVGL